MDMLCTVNCSRTAQLSINRTVPILISDRRRRSGKISHRKCFGFKVLSSAGGATSRRTSATADLVTGKSSAAMEQLDFERGVCVPFRKYTPETVRSSLLLFVYFVVFVEFQMVRIV